MPQKRQRTESFHQMAPPAALRRVGSMELKTAPDWGGNETSPSQPWGSTPGPYANPPSSIRPTTTHASSSTVRRNTTNPLSLSNPKWGLQTEVVLGLKACGVENMYQWQSECLSLPGLLEGEKNVVYTAPTSAGKSLVADVLTIKKAMSERKKVIIVLPYIAIVQEKTRFLKKCLGQLQVEIPRRSNKFPQRWRPLNIVGFHSGAKNRIGWKEIDIAICTIEKGNALVNGALAERTIDDLGLVVFDELHMLDDDHRGFILELLATKLLCLDHPTQIVGMSATISNVRTIAKWLKADFYECTYRPVPLQEYLVYENRIYSHSHALKAKIPASEIKELKDPVTNAVVALTSDAVEGGHGVLVFCESRQRCEDLGKLLVKFMPFPRDHELREKRMDIVRDLATTATGLDSALEKTIPVGVAFHHAGLTTEERDLITEGYDKALIKVIFCTPTMAAGVNLPARRVVIFPRIGRGFLCPAMLRQMRGRAGRKGRDTHGESYICCRKDDLAQVNEILNAEMPAVSSCLINDKSDCGLARALLEIVSTNLATSSHTIEDYFKATLLHHTHPDPTALPPMLDKCLARLQEMGLIEDVGSGYWEATKMGQATVSAGFAPEDGVFMHQELSRALRQFNLETDMHIVYQFTPIHGTDAQHGPEIDWRFLRDEIEKLDEGSLRAATFVGVKPAFVHRMATGGTFKEDTSEKVAQGRTYRRFNVSLILRALINEAPIHVVARKFDVARGLVQSLVTTCRGFAATSVTYCRVMGWSGLAAVLDHYSWRLDLGVKDDLIDLAKLPFVKSFTARVFWECGLKNVEMVAKEGVEKVLEAITKAQPKKPRLREGEEQKVAGRLRERAEVVVRAAERLWERECVVELED